MKFKEKGLLTKLTHRSD